MPPRPVWGVRWESAWGECHRPQPLNASTWPPIPRPPGHSLLGGASPATEVSPEKGKRGPDAAKECPAFFTPGGLGQANTSQPSPLPRLQISWLSHPRISRSKRLPRKFQLGGGVISLVGGWELQGASSLRWPPLPIWAQPFSLQKSGRPKERRKGVKCRWRGVPRPAEAE